MLPACADGRPLTPLGDLLGGEARLLEAGTPTGLDLLVLDAPHLFDRPGNPYVDADGARLAGQSPPLRRAGLGRGRDRPRRGSAAGGPTSSTRMTGRPASPRPIWRLAGGPRPATVLTVHNLAFQGLFPADLHRRARPAAGRLRGRRLRIPGAASAFSRPGSIYADRITTVSPTYAREIQTEAEGMGLHGLLRARRGDLVGITNGIDETVWDPAADRHLPCPYDASTLDDQGRATSSGCRSGFGPGTPSPAPCCSPWSAG